MDIPPPTHEPGDMQRAMECEELVRPFVKSIVASAITSGWTCNEVLIAVEEAVKDIRAAKSAPQ
jgi:hypothetical protein